VHQAVGRTVHGVLGVFGVGAVDDPQDVAHVNGRVHHLQTLSK
jgi:hypothetical protein